MRDWQLNAVGWFLTVLVAVVVVVLTGLGGYFLRDEFYLDARGERTSALVEKIVTDRTTDVIHIAYTPRGTRRTTRTTFQSLFGDDPRVGARISIDYDPQHPSRAREAGNHDGLLLVPVVFGLVGFYLWAMLKDTRLERTRRLRKRRRVR